jgi:chromate reductase
MNKKITIITASNGKNLEISKDIQTYLKDHAECEIIDLCALDISLYTPERDKDGVVPQDIIDKIPLLIESKALVFVAPEYNGSVPPTLTNFIAWVSRGADDWRACFNGKVAAIATFSGGGGLHALAAMRAQLSYIGMTVIGRPLHSNHQKPLTEDSIKDVMDQVLRLV